MIRNGLEQRCDELTPYSDYRLRKEWISSPLKALLKCPFPYHMAPAFFAITPERMTEGDRSFAGQTKKASLDNSQSAGHFTET